MSSLKELYLLGKSRLKEPHEVLIFCQELLGAGRRELALFGDEPPEPEKERRYLSALKERANGRPLQYILGCAYFRGMRLRVREGVLIPREDTEVLVQEALGYIGEESMTGYDLCAGTGAVALGIAGDAPQVKITAAELYEVPLGCLEENISLYGGGRVRPEKLDVTLPAKVCGLDFVVSNPPYVARGEFPALQPEVLLEPREALDGGDDGLDFYRLLVPAWRGALKSGGLMAFETGDTQSGGVGRILEENGFCKIKTVRDLGGLDRVVSGIKK